MLVFSFNPLDNGIDNDNDYSGARAREARASGAPWVRKSTHPRKFGNHVTVHRTNDRPSAPQAYQWKIGGGLWVQWEFWILGTRLFFGAKTNGHRVLWSINNLEVQRSQLRTKRNYFFCIGWQKLFLHSHFLEFSFIMLSSLEYRERERQRKRESRRQASQA